MSTRAIPELGADGLRRTIRMRSAAALVVANIIGAGVFTTTGFQAQDLPHPGWILALWIIGGVLALCGALAYAELGAALPRAGGEYVYLRHTYGPLWGFLTAFVSLIAGFSAPIAAACKAFARYLTHFFPQLEEARLAGGLVGEDVVALAAALGLAVVHGRAVGRGVAFNDLLTLLKVVGIVGILLGAALFGAGDLSHLTSVSPRFAEIPLADRLTAFGTGLVFVMFCYSGFNAAAYVAGEMERPQRDLPRALLLGTACVLALYLGLNAMYLYGAPVDELAGRAEVGLVAARSLFGAWGTGAVSLVLCLSILASASAMTIAGPRVYHAMGRDHPRLGWLAHTGPRGAPVGALWAQTLVVAAMILLGRIDQIQQYAGFTLALFSSLAVGCVLVLRRREPELPRPFRTWGYPLTPLLYLTVSAWMMIWALRGRPVESLAALATTLAGGGVFYLAGRARR